MSFKKYMNVDNSDDSEVCYICLESNTKDNNMVIACTTCNKPVHHDCIQTQIDNNLPNCGNCNTSLQSRSSHFNKNRLVRDILLFCLSILYVLCAIGIGLLATGQSFLYEINNHFTWLSLCITFIVSLSLGQYPPCCHYFQNNNDNNDDESDDSDEPYNINKTSARIIILTMLASILLQSAFIMICHGIGYLGQYVYTNQLNTDTNKIVTLRFFTSITFIFGVGLLLAFICAIIIISYIIRLIGIFIYSIWKFIPDMPTQIIDYYSDNTDPVVVVQAT